MKTKLRYLAAACFFTLFLLSCSNQPSGQDKQPEEQGGMAGGAQPEAGAIFTGPGLIPAGAVFEGQFLQGVRWESQGAGFYGLVSKYEQGEFFTQGWASRLHLYLYELRNGQISGRKAFVAEAPNIYSQTSLFPERTRLVNLPSLGQALSVAYSICPDGEDPCTLYASVFNEKAKYDFQVMENVDKAIYFESRTEIMAGIPEDVQVHLLEQLFPDAGR